MDADCTIRAGDHITLTIYMYTNEIVRNLELDRLLLHWHMREGGVLHREHAIDSMTLTPYSPDQR